MHNNSTRELNYATAILEATDQCMAKDQSVYLMGLGVDDPKGIFGTTLNLHKKYGKERVFDVPVAENGLTGFAIGSATLGMRPILTHQRLDFALLSLDQIINNAAKWHYMFAGQHRCPLVIRMIIGRGWGQGPQHSQSFQSIFAHIPGLKVVMPTTPHDAKGLLVSSIEDDNPVIFLEHRWLHGTKGPVSEDIFREPIGKAKIVKPGKDVTVVGTSYMVLEAFRAAEHLEKHGMSAEVIDLRSIKPFDGDLILESVRKTGRLVVADTGHLTCGVASEIVAHVTEKAFDALKAAPVRVASPDSPAPTSPALAKYYYPRSHTVAEAILTTFYGSRFQETIHPAIAELKAIEDKTPADVPDLNFNGPF